MKKQIMTVLLILGVMVAGADRIPAQGRGPAQKRIMIERGEKVKGQRLKLVKKVVESYKGCQVLSDGNELTGLVINGKTYSDFTIVIRDAKRTIVVVTADGIVSFDY
jgi:hypothetical protein